MDSPASGHPGTFKTLELLKEKKREINEVISSCSTCAQAKVPRHFPAGKLIPLKNPQRPWSHITLDFFTDLPEPDDKTTILKIIDRFSRFLKFIPLFNYYLIMCFHQRLENVTETSKQYADRGHSNPPQYKPGDQV